MGGSIKVNIDCPAHELLSIIVTVYTPAASPLISSVRAPLLHVIEYGLVPPDTVKSILPSR
jgi:hypothetical protein